MALKKPAPKKSLSKPATKSLAKKKGKPLSKKEVGHVVKQSATAAAPTPTPAKKTLTKPTPPPAPVVREFPKIPKGWKWVGKKVKFSNGSFLLVASSDLPPKFVSMHKNCAPGTFFRIDTKTKSKKVTDIVVDLITVMPKAKGRDGVKCSWASCGTCGNHFLLCTCKEGLVHPRSIEWIYIRALMTQDGLYTGTTQPIIDSTGMEVTSRALHHYASRRTQTPTGAPYRTRDWSAGTSAQSTAAKPSRGLTKPLSKSLKKAGSGDRLSSNGPKAVWKDEPRTKPLKKKDQVDVSDLDLTKLGKDAEKSADALTDSLVKSLSKPGTKSLKKRGK